MFLTLALLSSGYTTKPLLPPSHTMNQIIEETPRIEILPMSQRSQVQNLGEDWTGTGSTALRRRLQNRLNQRASRLYPLNFHVDLDRHTCINLLLQDNVKRLN